MTHDDIFDNRNILFAKGKNKGDGEYFNINQTDDDLIKIHDADNADDVSVYQDGVDGYWLVDEQGADEDGFAWAIGIDLETL